MSYFPFLPGQQPMSSSQGVVIASNQSPVSIAGTVNVAGNPSISGTVQVGNFPTTQNVSGSVAAFESGTWTASLVSTVPSSVIVGASIFGQLPAGTAVLGSVAALQGTNPWITTFSNSSIVAYQLAGSVLATSATVNTGNSSVMLLNGANTIGSVTALQGTNPWITTFSNASILTFVSNTSLNVNGSVVATQSGAWSASMVGTPVRSLNSGVTFNASGPDTNVAVIAGFRNDAVASVISADLRYNSLATDSAGRHLIKPFAADESRLDTATSIVSGSVTALFNSVVGLRNYVTDIMVANTGSVATLVTFQDGSTSILGYTIAPAGGGSNINGMAFPLRTAPSQDFSFKMSPSSSVLYVTAKGYKAP